MGHYKSNVRDIEFNLFEVLGTDAILGTPPFTDIDQETARGILAEVARLAEGPVGESFADGDRTVVLDHGARLKIVQGAVR